jgi:hypothetical protein
MTPESIRPFAPALLLAVGAALFGQGIGAAFGLGEERMKASLKSDADSVLATAYDGDAAKAKAVVDKSWVYYQRAHLHGGALGTFALALALLLAWLPGSLFMRRACGFAVSLGAMGYSVFWLLAGMRAPGLGSTGAAKESLAWLALPSSTLVIGGTIIAFVLVALQLRRGAEADGVSLAARASS